MLKKIVNFFKKYYVYFITFGIYSYFFCKLGNTCSRTNSEGIKKLNFLPLFTEGFIGPIRTLIILIKQGSLKQIIKYIKFELENLANPFSTFFIVININSILKANKVIK
jgi:hypothetical protein